MRPKTIIATLALAGMASLPVTSSATGLGSHSSAAYEGMQSEQAFDEGRYQEDSQQLGGYMDPGLGSDMSFETSTLRETWYHPDGTVVYHYPDWTIVGHADVDALSASSGSSFDYSAAGEFADESLDGRELGESSLIEPSISSGESSDAISQYSDDLSGEGPDATLLGGAALDDSSASGGSSFDSSAGVSGSVSEPEISDSTAELSSDFSSGSADVLSQSELDEPSASSGSSMDSTADLSSGFDYDTQDPALLGQSEVNESSGSSSWSYSYESSDALGQTEMNESSGSSSWSYDSGSGDQLSSESSTEGEISNEGEISSHSASESDSIGSDWRVS